MEELSGRVAVVTGAASGIGLALVQAFVAEGMKVVMADIETEALEQAAADLPEDAETLTVVCDVSDGDQVDALRDAAVEQFGTVHVVCNNAGVAGGGPIWAQSRADWDWVLGVNLYGVINGITSFTPLLIEQGEGHIVNTASMAGMLSMPWGGTYNVSKHGVVTLSETLWADLQLAGATGVGVSVLCPGWVQTRIAESGRNRPVDPAAPATARSEEELATLAHVGNLVAEGLNPHQVAELVLDSVRTGRFYIFTHPTWMPLISDRFDRITSGEGPGFAPLPGMMDDPA
ncbi:SDR family NAD(P)-dependent oxidoreductase [Aquihabitans daechungensis]|uniref:SDR family NAD(P)-dependent oxidoreductase n=1 Tax=Aquihabitans daechungensis TaxID=1052257 RepID=UPI003BA3BF23